MDKTKASISLIVLSSGIVKNSRCYEMLHIKKKIVSSKVKAVADGTCEKVIQLIHQMSPVRSSEDAVVQF